MGNEAAIKLTKLVANEREDSGSLFSVAVENAGTPSGFPMAAGISSLNVYSIDNLLVADLDLASPQSKLIVSVYDIAGRMITNKMFENPDRGKLRLSFPMETGTLNRNSRLYLVTIRGDDFTVTRKLVVR